MTPRIAVIGDSLLDIDVEGVSTRRMPDAPAPVVDELNCGYRPGGAGLAAVLAREFGAEVTLLTALADDPEGDRLRDLLGEKVEVAAIPLDGLTNCKRRIRSNGEIVMRLDQGDGRASRSPVAKRILDRVEGVDAVLVSDYGRGVAANPDVRRAISRLTKNIPVVWDPHPKGPRIVPGVSLATPNEGEARRVCPDLPPAMAARELVNRWGCKAVAVTTGASGAVFAERLFDGETTVPVPEHLQSRGDTCGAGDAFAAAAAVASTQTSSIPSIVETAVNGAIEYVRAGGPEQFSVPDPNRSRPTGEDGFALAQRIRRCGGRIIATGGCFDLLHAGHVQLLEQARALGDVLIVCLNSDASVAASKGPNRPIVPAKERAAVLLALSAVDAVIVFDAPSPTGVLEQLRPDVWVKGSDYAGQVMDEAATVRRHGGEIVLVPVLSGHSTTRLVVAARKSA